LVLQITQAVNTWHKLLLRPEKPQPKQRHSSIQQRGRFLHYTAVFSPTHPPA